VNTTEWEKLVKGTVGIPKTDLEKERHSFYSQVEFQSFETIANKDDLEHFKQVRYEEYNLRSYMNMRNINFEFCYSFLEQIGE
jgi:hypothetical protein